MEQNKIKIEQSQGTRYKQKHAGGQVHLGLTSPKYVLNRPTNHANSPPRPSGAREAAGYFERVRNAHEGERSGLTGRAH